VIDASSTVLGLVAGALLLIAGRRLFWLFVGLVGFFAGLRFVPTLFSGQPEWMQWLVAALFGLAGMFLAIVMQRFAVALAGFLVGGFLAADLFGAHIFEPGLAEVLIFVVGGIVVAAFSLWLFEGALIVLSSLVGAGLIVDALDISPGTSNLALLGLTVLGIAIQAGITARRRGHNYDRTRPPVHFLLLLLLLGSIPAASQDRPAREPGSLAREPGDLSHEPTIPASRAS
jgi:hypothetical protein